MKLDYFYGRKVTSIFTTEDDPHCWSIQLDGGVVIKNQDEALTTPPDSQIMGMTFYSHTCDLPTDSVVLKFGRYTTDPNNGELQVVTIAEVDLTNSLYSIAQPGVPEIQPGVPVNDPNPLPPDPSGERVVDGPANP